MYTQIVLSRNQKNIVKYALAGKLVQNKIIKINLDPKNVRHLQKQKQIFKCVSVHFVLILSF